MEIIDVLKRAREILANQGVARNGEFYDQVNDCFCSLGAVEVATGMRTTTGEWDYDAESVEAWDLRVKAQQVLDDTRKTLLEEQPDEYRRPRQTIPRFNDLSETDEEVLDLFDRTIARLTA